MPKEDEDFIIDISDKKKYFKDYAKDSKAWIESCVPIPPGELNLIMVKAASSKWLEFRINEIENIFKEGAD